MYLYPSHTRTNLTWWSVGCLWVRSIHRQCEICWGEQGCLDTTRDHVNTVILARRWSCWNSQPSSWYWLRHAPGAFACIRSCHTSVSYTRTRRDNAGSAYSSVAVNTTVTGAGQTRTTGTSNAVSSCYGSWCGSCIVTINHTGSCTDKSRKTRNSSCSGIALSHHSVKEKNKA